MKTSTHNPVESIEHQHFKKRYLARKAQEEEANDVIRQYNYEEAGRREGEQTVPQASDVVEKRQL